jgi:hypothetical protein
MLSRFACSAASLAALFAFAVLFACSNQGEGGRCDHQASNGGNDDCQDGLICWQASSLGNGAGYDACCPVDRTTATTAVCSLNQATGIDASSVIPDTGVTPDSNTPPPPDASMGADSPPPVDAPMTPDAPPDAPAAG